MPLVRWRHDRIAADIRQVLQVRRLSGGGWEGGGRWRRVKGEGDACRRFGLARRLLRATAVESGTVPEASRSAKRTLDAPVARYPVGGDWRSSAFGGRRAAGPAHAFLGLHSRPPIPAPRRGRGSGGWPPGCGSGTVRDPVAVPAALIRRRGRRPCRRRCAGTARGVRLGGAGRPRGRSPRRRPRRAGRSRSRA